MMNKIWILSILLSLLLCGCNDTVVVVNSGEPETKPEAETVEVPHRSPAQKMTLYRSRKEKDWEYRLYVSNQGSRSQGWHGELFFGSQQILGVSKGERLITPLGTYVWNGRLEERVEPWSKSGWMSVQKNSIRPLELPMRRFTRQNR